MSRDELLQLAGKASAAESRAAAELSRAKREVKRLEAICEKQVEQLESLKRSKFKFSKQRPGKPGKTFIRFIIPDTHGSMIDQAASAAMFADMEQMSSKIGEVVLLGDHLECGGFLAQHHVLGYVAQSEYTFADDVTAANAFLDEVQARAPKARIHYLEGNHECLTPEHEVLTSDGWKPIADVTCSDLVASMDEDGCTVWGNPLAVHSYQYDGDLVCLNGSCAKIEMTPEHRVWYWSQNKKDLICRKAKRIYGTTTAYHLPVSASNTNPELDGFDDDWLRLLGWILTDGTLSSNTLAIFQSKPDGVLVIREILQQLGLDFTESVRERVSYFGGSALPSTTFTLSAESRRLVLRKLWGVDTCECETKVIPDWVSDLSERQFSVFFESVLDGDGTRTKPVKGYACCLYGKKPFLEAMQRLLVVNGYACSLSTRWKHGEAVYDCLNITRRLYKKIEGSSFHLKPYSGRVHCLTTLHDNFFVRLRGRVSVTGNSRIERWVVDQVVGHSRDKEYLHSAFSTESVLGLRDRGIDFYSSGGFYGLRVPGAIKLGKCHFLHGSNHGKDVARKMAGMFGGNVVFAHVHTQQAVTVRTVTAGEVGAWCPGCVCKIQPLYRHSSITDWSHGYAFQIVNVRTGEFLHVNVPIADGKSLLRGFAGVL